MHETNLLIDRLANDLAVIILDKSLTQEQQHAKMVPYLTKLIDEVGGQFALQIWNAVTKGILTETRH